MAKSIILVGMMGVGKTSVGEALAERLDREFADTDRLLVSRLGRSIPQIFQLYGESTFREHETSILRSLEPGRQVVSTGGGIVLRDENWLEMRRLGVTVFLSMPLEIVLERLAVSRKRRPLLEVEDPEARVREVYASRLHRYELADYHVELEDSGVESAVDSVVQALGDFDDD